MAKKVKKAAHAESLIWLINAPDGKRFRAVSLYMRPRCGKSCKPLFHLKNIEQREAC